MRMAQTLEAARVHGARWSASRPVHRSAGWPPFVPAAGASPAARRRTSILIIVRAAAALSAFARSHASGGKRRSTSAHCCGGSRGGGSCGGGGGSGARWPASRPVTGRLAGHRSSRRLAQAQGCFIPPGGRRTASDGWRTAITHIDKTRRTAATMTTQPRAR